MEGTLTKHHDSRNVEGFNIMFITTEPCQYCGNQQVEAPWTLCRDCRRVYAKTLHRLRRDMMLLQQVSRHAYKLGEPGAGGKPQGGAAPAPINLHAQDMLDQIEDGLQDMWNETGVESRPRWQTLLRDSPRRLPDLCRASRSGHWLTWLIHTCERIEPLVDRRPRTRRIIGVCPECLNGRDEQGEPVRTPIYAARDARYAICPACGAWLDLRRIRLEYLRSAGLMHITRTQADAARWIRANTGVNVSGNDLKNWRARGKMPSTRHIEGPYWAWNVLELLACAQAKDERDHDDA